MPLDAADEKQIDAYLDKCANDELEAIRERVAREREAQWKVLGDIIRKTDPRHNPDVRAYILQLLRGGIDYVPADDPTKASQRRRLMEAQILASAEPARLKQITEKVLLRKSSDEQQHLRLKNIDPLDVPSIRRDVVRELVNE